MQIKNTIILSLLLVISSTLFAQFEDLDISVSRKFLTLRNARLSLGAIATFSPTFTNEEQGTRSNPFNYYDTNLPGEYGVDFSQEDNPNLSVGLLLDFFSPNSVLGITIGAEYQSLTYNIELNDSPISTLNPTYLRLPVFLKAQTGSVHSKWSVILMGGGYYALPIDYSREGPNGTFEDTNEINGGVGLSAILGLQFRFLGTATGQTSQSEYNRSWLFVRADYPLFSQLSEPTLTEISQLGRADLSLNTFHVSVGIAMFLKLN